jgi:hypothetical protein
MQAVAVEEVGGGHRAFAGGLEFEDFEWMVACGDEEVGLGVEDRAGRDPHVTTSSSEQPALSRIKSVGGDPHPALSQGERVDGDAVDVEAEWFGVVAMPVSKGAGPGAECSHLVFDFLG